MKKLLLALCLGILAMIPACRCRENCCPTRAPRCAAPACPAPNTCATGTCGVSYDAPTQTRVVKRQPRQPQQSYATKTKKQKTTYQANGGTKVTTKTMATENVQAPVDADYGDYDDVVDGDEENMAGSGEYQV